MSSVPHSVELSEDKGQPGSPEHSQAGFPSKEGAAAIRLRNVTKRYGSVTAVASADLDLARGELFTLLGASGSGKTTILRMIAGLVPPTAGEIWVGDEEIHARPTHERNIGLVFQSLALFPHLDVFG